MNAARGREYVLTLSCPDKPGIVYAVSSFLVQHSGNILDSQQYGESPDGRFFMRVHFAVPPQNQSPEESLASLQHGFSWVAEAFHMSWQLHDQAVRIRTLFMVSKLGHCLNDLLFRWKIGSLPVDKVVHQCGSGITACHNLLAMEIAGLAGSRLYAGSWSEWIAEPSRPVAK